MNIFEKQDKGMNLINKFRKDSGKALSDYCNFHKDIQFKCQATIAKARLEHSLESKEYEEIANKAVKEYEEKNRPVWETYKEEDKNIYESYIKEMQKIGYYKTEE